MTLTASKILEYDASQPAPHETETVTFGIGCFWGPDAAFGAMDGVVRTRLGYAGGTTPNPSYSSLGDHSEVLQVDVDPSQLSVSDVFAQFFRRHNPREQPAKRQYQNLLLVSSSEQRQAVADVIEASEYSRDRIETRIEDLSKFHLAESYHQKYQLASKRWITDAFDTAGYDQAQRRESPAAATLNGHVSGHDVDVPFLDGRSR